MSRTYYDMGALVAAAAGCDCSVHLHVDEQHRMVLSVGNEDRGATEFLSYTEALEACQDENLTAADCAERAGAALADGCLRSIREASSQAERLNAIHAALLGLQRLQHPERAADGFASMLVPFVERGLGVSQ